MTVILQMILLNAFVLCVVQVLTDVSTCSVCQCSESNQFNIKHADCTRETIHLDITKIPDNLDSQIESLSLKEQLLNHIEQEAFYIPYLRIVNMEKCKIETVDKNAFTNLRNLSELNLGHNKIEALNPEIFKFNKNLQIVQLNNNKLKSVDDRLFADLILLNKLYLNDNKITSIHRLAFVTNVHIKSLFVQNNQLSYIDSYAIGNLTQLNELYLEGNPWSCDCRLRKLHEDLFKRQFSHINVTCHQPATFRGLAWAEISATDFSCFLNGTWNESVTSVIVYNRFSHLLLCVVQATPEPTVTWTRDGHAIEYEKFKLKYIMKRSVNYSTYSYSLTILNVSSTDNGEYKCKIRNCEEEIVKTFILKFAQPPRILLVKKSSVFADFEAENFTLSCKVSGIPRPAINWEFQPLITKTWYLNSIGCSTCKYISRGEILGTDTYWANLTFVSDVKFLEGYYECNARNIIGNEAESIYLNVKELRFVMINTTDLYETRELTNITIPCGVVAWSEPLFVWTHYNGTYLTKNSENNKKYSVSIVRDKNKYWYNLTFFNILSEQSGKYSCRATNSSDDFRVKIVTLRVTRPPTIIKTRNNYTVLGSSKITLGCGATSALKAVITWKYKQLPLDIRNSIEKYSTDIKTNKNGIYWNNLTIFNVNAQDHGEYYCTANNSDGFDERIFTIDVISVDILVQTKTVIAISTVGCVIFVILVVIIVIKCSMRYYAVRNNKNVPLFK